MLIKPNCFSLGFSIQSEKSIFSKEHLITKGKHKFLLNFFGKGNEGNLVLVDDFLKSLLVLQLIWNLHRKILEIFGLKISF